MHARSATYSKSEQWTVQQEEENMCQEVPVMKYSAKNMSILFGQTDNFVAHGDCFQQF